MRRLEISILLSVVFSAVLSMMALNTECSDIRGSVLRMHVLANSDSEADQELKLKVRDRLLEVSDVIYSKAKTKEEAVQATEKNISMLRDVARAVVLSNGYDYPVSVSLEESYFGTRTYGSITLPAGKYQAVRVVIGKGAGHNWWCVMFPPLCISAASEDEALLSDMLTREQLKLVEGDGYEIRFKCVEVYEEFMSYLNDKNDKHHKSINK